MHSGIITGLLCDAHTVSEQHRGTAALFLCLHVCVCHSDSPISFLGASIVCTINLKRVAD